MNIQVVTNIAIENNYYTATYVLEKAYIVKCLPNSILVVKEDNGWVAYDIMDYENNKITIFGIHSTIEYFDNKSLEEVFDYMMNWQ